MENDESAPVGCVATAPCWAGLEELREGLQRYLGPRCRDANEADDVIQETFLRAARYRGSLADGRRLRAWVVQIASNVLRDRVLRSGRGPASGLEDEQCETIEGREPFPGDLRDQTVFSVAGEEIDGDTALVHLEDGLAALRASDRRVLDEYYAGGENCALAAERCGLSPELVKVRLFRARRRLERLMQQRVATARTRRLLGVNPRAKPLADAPS